MVLPVTHPTHVIAAVRAAAVRHVSRMRPTSALVLFICVSLLSVALAYHLTLAIVVKPLTHIQFNWVSQVSAGDVTRSVWDPALASTFVIGASWINRSEEVRQRRAHLSYAALPMRRPEVDLLLSQLRPSDTLLEFGGSATTLTFPYFTNHTYTIEHNALVCDALAREIRAHADTADDDLARRVRTFCVAAPDWAPKTSPLEEGSYAAFRDYVDFPRSNLSHVTFDRVLVNGRARVACALRILPQLHASSLVFFHDFLLRPAHYARVLPYYDEVARVVAHRAIGRGDAHYTDEPMGLVVFRPKAGYTGHDVSEAEVHAAYDDYVEEAPSAETTGFKVAVAHGLGDSLQGAYPYYEMSRSLSRQTSKVRLLLDSIALPFVIACFFGINAFFSSAFRNSILGASPPKQALPVTNDPTTTSTTKTTTATANPTHQQPDVPATLMLDLPAPSADFVGNTTNAVGRPTKTNSESKSD